MHRSCPECGLARVLGPGYPVVARCGCGRVWCWLCRRTVTVDAAIATVEATVGDQLSGITPAVLRALDRARSGEGFEAAAAAVHTLGPRRWRGGLQALGGNATGSSPAPGPCGTTACPAYLELVEHSGVFTDLFDAENLAGAENRRVWAGVCRHETAEGEPVEPTIVLRRDVARP